MIRVLRDKEIKMYIHIKIKLCLITTDHKASLYTFAVPTRWCLTLPTTHHRVPSQLFKKKKKFETSTSSSRTGEGRWEANKYLVKAPLNLQSLVRKYSSCMTSWPPNSSPPAQLPGSNSGGFSNKQQLQTCFTKQCTNPCCLEGGTGLLEEQARPQGAISKGRLLRVGRQVTWAPVICWLITASFHLTRFIVKPAHNPLSV